MVDAAMMQLLDMGIPSARARAALKRSKGDAMSAAERVFAGEFDDLPSDDEMDVDGEQENAKANALSSERVSVQRYEKADDGEFEGIDGFNDFDDEEELQEERLLSDPYANVFFSKDRVEKIIEPVEEDIWASIAVPGLSGKQERVRILGRGEWMSGCPESNEQSFLFQLYSMLEAGTQPCSGCGHPLDRRQSDFFALLTDFPVYLAHLNAVIQKTCSKCSQTTCMACGERSGRRSAPFTIGHQGTSSKGKGKKKAGDSNDLEALLHCPNVQGVILGMGLHMIEQAFHQSRSLPTPSSPQKSPAPKKRKPNIISKWLSTAEADEDMYDSDSPDMMYAGLGMGGMAKQSKGTGYAGSQTEDRSGQEAAEKAQAAADAKTTELLCQVRDYLPSMNRPGGPRPSDHMVHPTALAHLRRRSGFVNDLLRNDSLLDMSKRGDLYRALLDWLKIVSNHESLASMLAMPQMRPGASEPIPTEPGQKLVTYEGAQSPRELLENVVIQSQAALKGLGATAYKAPIRDEEEEMRMSMEEMKRKKAESDQEAMEREPSQLKAFCEAILNAAEAIDRSLVEVKGKPFVDRMRAALPKLPDVGTKEIAAVGEGVQGGEGITKIYEEWAMRARFQYCDMSRVSDGLRSYKHAYSSMITGIDNMDMPKRSLAIAKELAILTTSLPVAWNSTIFLRVDEARVDCLKAMIIGPEGTPYQNGCFIFDIFLPIDYNTKCPSVKSMTTNGGKYRYNPNLYADGKVCLSLLGTWTGPGWISGQSTLLQVLISIQSLILCEEPYLNEPGWAGDGGSKASQDYSANIRRMVLVDAMANNIKKPPFPFESEIKTHFRLKAKSIRTQIEEWRKLDNGHSVKTEYAHSYHASPDGVAEAGTNVITFDKAAQGLVKLLDELEVKGSGNAEAAHEVVSETKGQTSGGLV